MKVIVDGVQFNTDNVRIEFDHGINAEIGPDTIVIINPANPTEPEYLDTKEIFSIVED